MRHTALGLETSGSGMGLLRTGKLRRCGVSQGGAEKEEAQGQHPSPCQYLREELIKMEKQETRNRRENGKGCGIKKRRDSIK